MTLNTKSPTKIENMQGKTMLVFLLLLLCQNIFSQFYWQKTYSAFGDEEAYDICPADNNNYYLVGITAPFFRKAYVIKINEFGDTLWTRTYFDGEIYTAAPTNDGGCIFAGYSGQAFACRINSDGDTLWIKRYNTINFLDIIKTSDNNYILCGANYTNEHYNGYACKIDINGNLLWEKIYQATATKDLFGIESCIDGGFLLFGTITGFSGSFSRAYLIKINNSGDLIWEKSYKINTSDIVTGVQAGNNSYFLTGSSNGKLYILKTNLLGDSLNCSVLTNTNITGYGPIIIKITNNKFYSANINGYTQTLISKIDSNLNLVNQITLYQFEGISLRSAIEVSNSNLGDMIFVGTTAFEPGNEEAYAIRIDSALTPPPPISTSNNAIFVPTIYTLFQNYPNPFNPVTKIRFQISGSSVAQTFLSVYDITGKEISLLVNANLKPGSYEVSFDASGLSSGVYFYKISAGSFTDVKKMVLLK